MNAATEMTKADDGEAVLNKRQQKIIDCAEKVVADAERDLEAAEDALSEARNRLRSAQRELYRLQEMGDML